MTATLPSPKRPGHPTYTKAPLGSEWDSQAHNLSKVFQSMSRRATCHDNAAMESFFHIMKVEMNYFTHHFDTKKQLVKAMKEGIVITMKIEFGTN